MKNQNLSISININLSMPSVDENNGWMNGVNVCDKCSNNPKNGGGGICLCTIPSLYGPLRITC